MARDVDDALRGLLGDEPEARARRWVPPQPARVGHVDGVEVELTGVTVDVEVQVHLEAAATPEAARLVREFEQALTAWGERSRAERDRSDPPAQPARRGRHR